MIVGIVGLGLIGGSFAKAYSHAGHTVYAYDTDTSVLDFSQIYGAVAGRLEDDRLSECDLILICTYPDAALNFLAEKGSLFGSKPVVIDCCGTKRCIVNKAMEIAAQHGFTYVGGHPMAGTQYSGFKNSKEDMFVGAPMVIIPPRNDDIVFLNGIKKLLEPAGFGSITVTDADKHDKMIAFTSQLAHVVSSAYIKSPTALEHIGFSAGSYRDMTRVAWLNPAMWTELFMDNNDYLINEIDTLIDNLSEYRDAIKAGDAAKLESLLNDGKIRKEQLDSY